MSWALKQVVSDDFSEQTSPANEFVNIFLELILFFNKLKSSNYIETEGIQKTSCVVTLFKLRNPIF